MKRRYFIILILTVVISLFIPIALWSSSYFTNFSDKINSPVLADLATFLALIISFWGFILNIVLVILAYKAFKNFDVKKQFLNKQLEVVADLASSINDLELSNMLYWTSTDPDGKDHLLAEGYTLEFFEIAFRFKYQDFERIFVKGNNIEKTFPFLRFKNHPMLPKTISKSLIKFYRPLNYTLATPKKKLPKKYVVLYEEKPKTGEDYTADLYYEIYSKPNEFKEDAIELRNSIINWLKEYGAKDVNF